jgi:iron complex outermembrane receptor protein
MSLALKNGLFCPVALTAAAMCTVTAASAQTLALEEVVVTAQRRETSLQTTPVSVSAFTGEQLERLQLSSTEDIGDYVPNLYLSDGISSPSTLNVFMRGLGTGGGGIITNEPPVAVYADDVYQARLSATNNEFADIERVEVLRGPQGTLFGRNSMTGAINVISRTPDDDTYMNAEASFGKYETATLKAAAGGALSPGKLAASISLVFRDQGKGVKDNIATGRDIDQEDFLGIRGKLHFYGSDKFDAVLTAYYSDSENDGFVATAVDTVTLQPVTGDFFVTQSPVDSFGDSEQIGTNFRFTYDFGGATLKSISAYSELDDAWRFDLGGGTEFMPGDFRTVFERTSIMNQDQFTQEVQLYGSAVDDRLDWIVGAYYFTEDSAQQFTDFFFLDFLGFAIPLPVTDYTVSTESYAVYGEINYAMTDDLTFIVGARYTEEDKAIAGVKAIPFANDTSYSAVTPKVGLEYAVNDDIFLYFTASSGFKAGGYEGLGGSAAVIANPFEEETLWAYEFGSKLDLMDNRLRLNLAVFFNDMKDLQSGILDPAFPGNATTVNAIDAELLGFEAELTVLVSEQWTLFAMLGLQDETFTRIDPRSLVALSGATRMGGIPRHQGSLGFTYEAAAPSLNGSIVVGADFVFRDYFWASADNLPITRIPSLTRYNARIGYVTNDEHWSVTLSGRNLTDEVDVVNGLSIGLPVGIQQTLDPLTWTLSLKYRY